MPKVRETDERKEKKRKELLESRNEKSSGSGTKRNCRKNEIQAITR